MMTSLLAAAVLGAMLLFNTAITPVVFTRLDTSSQGAFLRAAFPNLFLFGLIGTVAVVVAALFENDLPVAALGITAAIGFAVNAWVVTPAINRARDQGTGHFKLLHGVSVAMFIAKLLVLGLIIWLSVP